MKQDHEQKESLAFTARVAQCGLTVRQMHDALAARGCTTQKGTPISFSQVYGWYRGFCAVSRHLQPTVAEISGVPWPFSDDAPPNAQQKAVEAESLHVALKRLRQVLRMDHDQLSQALEPHLPSGIAPLSDTIKLWEKPKFSGGKVPSRRIFEGTDAITVYGKVLQEHGHGAWFEAHAPHFRHLMEGAIDPAPNSRKRAQPTPRSAGESWQL